MGHFIGNGDWKRIYAVPWWKRCVEHWDMLDGETQIYIGNSKQIGVTNDIGYPECFRIYYDVKKCWRCLVYIRAIRDHFCHWLQIVRLFRCTRWKECCMWFGHAGWIDKYMNCWQQGPFLCLWLQSFSSYTMKRMLRVIRACCMDRQI